MASYLPAQLNIFLELLIQREVSLRCGGFRREEKQRCETRQESAQDLGGMGTSGREEGPEGRGVVTLIPRSPARPRPGALACVAS